MSGLGSMIEASTTSSTGIAVPIMKMRRTTSETIEELNSSVIADIAAKKERKEKGISSPKNEKQAY